jgi:membrane-bound lytic murein transglycosylase B
MNKKYKKYPGMKMIKRATGSSKVESTMYKAGQKMRNILDKGLLSFIKKPSLPKGMEQSASKPSAIANQKPAKPTSKPSAPFANQKFATKTKQAGDIFKKLASSKVAKVAKFARVATPVGAALTIASGLGTYEKGKSPQELAKKASEKGKEYKVADEFTVVGSEGTKKVKMKSQGGMIIGKQADYIKDLI